MSSASFDISAQHFARRLEDRERERYGVPLSIARNAVARRTGIAVGTLENLRRGRIKGVREWVVAALRNAILKEIETDLVRLDHERLVILASSQGVDHREIKEVEASIATLRQTLRGEQ